MSGNLCYLDSYFLLLSLSFSPHAIQILYTTNLTKNIFISYWSFYRGLGSSVNASECNLLHVTAVVLIDD